MNQSSSELQCIFEKPILHRKYVCQQSNKINIGEQELIRCLDVDCNRLCDEFYNKLLDQCRFIIKTPSRVQPLPFNLSMKIQFGALIGLEKLMTPHSPRRIDAPLDIHQLIHLSVNWFNDSNPLPFNKLVVEIASFRPRNR